MKKLFTLIFICGALCTLASCEKDNDNPEPETNRFVLSGKNYSNFTVSVTKYQLNKGNYDICVRPAEDNTMELWLECSMQHDGVSLDLTKVDPLLAVQDYEGWCWHIYAKKLNTEEAKYEYFLKGWGGDDPDFGVAGDILYIKSLNKDHTQFEIRCKLTDPEKRSLVFYYKGNVTLATE